MYASKSSPAKAVFIPSSYPNLITAFNVEGMDAVLALRAAFSIASFISSSPFLVRQRNHSNSHPEGSVILILLLGHWPVEEEEWAMLMRQC